MNLLRPVIRSLLLAAVAAAAAVVAGCSGVGGPRPATPARTPPAQVGVPDRDFESRAVLLLLADRRLYEARTLELMLDGSARVRRELALTLGRIGDRRGRALLQGLLIDSVVEVRRAAAFALGELGAPEAQRALTVAAVDDDFEVGWLAVEALGKLGVPLAEVLRPLGALAPGAARAANAANAANAASTAAGAGQPGGAQRRLAAHLFRFREPPATETAREMLTSDLEEVRRGGIYALGRNASPEGLGLLRAALGDRDPFVRAWAARGVGDVGGLDDLARLAPLLADQVDSVRIQALRAGGKLMGRVEALPPLDWGDQLALLTVDAVVGTRATALEVAGHFLPHPMLEAAVRRAWSEGEPRERELALQSLVAGKVADARELVEAAAASEDRWLRARAAEAAGEIGAEELVARLARDEQALVRVSALGAASSLGDRDDRSLLLAALDDRDPAVRAAAVDALALAPELPTPRLLRLIDRARADGAENDVRRTGIDVLTQRGKESPERELAPAIEALARIAAGDEDWLVRRAAADALAELGEERPEIGALDTGRSLETYRELLRQAERPVEVEVETERGILGLELACPEAPLTCLSFLQLARSGYFDGVRFHRVVPDFVVQGGDPRGDGWGGPGYSLRDEINRLRYLRGALGMALSGPDTGGSQFFIALAPQPHLDGGFTVFGRLVRGDEVLDQIRQGDRIVHVRELVGSRTAPVR